MSAKILLFRHPAREKVLQGVRKVANAVKVTLGPKGRNVAIEKTWTSPEITKDGVTVARKIEFDDKLENLGAQMIKDAAEHTNDLVGDGTTTATVLTNAIAEQGMKALTGGYSPIELKKGMEAGLKLLVEELKKGSRPIVNESEMAQVGSISSNGDKEIGTLIAEVVSKIGSEGVATVEESTSSETRVRHLDGMQWDRGYLSPYFITNEQELTTELFNPYILLFDEKIKSINELLPVLQLVVESNRPLLIVAEDLESEPLAGLILNKLKGILNVAAVKGPSFGSDQVDFLKDLAAICGGQLISKEFGRDLQHTELSHLGQAQRVHITKESTCIIGGSGNKDEINRRMTEIRVLKERSTGIEEKQRFATRLSKMQGGVSLIEVGAHTETALKEKKERIEDALNATRAAVEEGVVIGGGCTLVHLSKKLDQLKLGPEQNAGLLILKNALLEPLYQIAENAGKEGRVVVAKVLENEDPQWGFNAQTETYENLERAGVLDPTKVLRTALQTAVSIGALLLTTETIMAEKPIDPKNKKRSPLDMEYPDY